MFNRVKWFFRNAKPSDLVSLFSVVLGSFALFFSTSQNYHASRLTEMHDHAVVKPFIRFGFGNGGIETCGFSISNVGPGQAILKEIQYYYKVSL
jgi:hypothetical protein